MLDNSPFFFFPEQDDWLNALKSGDFQQAQGYLVKNCASGLRFCCLGVAYQQLRGSSFEELHRCRHSYLDEEDAAALRLKSVEGQFIDHPVWYPSGVKVDIATSLAALNDGARWSFCQIESYIRQNPRNVFTEGDTFVPLPPYKAIEGSYIATSCNILMVTVRAQSSFGMHNTARRIIVTRREHDALHEWCKGNLLIQEALPNMPAGKREAFLTGLTEEEWDEMFKEEIEAERIDHAKEIQEEMKPYEED